eukprot:GHUV01000520.1.p1 GENE.GHUV01000520.1~~GHUV01000520.1.p1  ORF type:complete len:257 (+),score=54.60 GHUV01000520.1:65-835(+)
MHAGVPRPCATPFANVLSRLIASARNTTSFGSLKMTRSGNQHSTAAVAALAVLLCTLKYGCCADDVIDDPSGYDKYYDKYYDYYSGIDAVQDCTVDEAGKVKLADGAAPYGCDIKVEGVDKQADLLTGGIDGVYKLYSCKNGRPAYLRQNSPKAEERVLWYSSSYGDWDISRGPKPDPTDILMYGGDVEHHPVPLFVKNWHLGGDLKSGTDKANMYVPLEATVKCADGMVVKPPAANPPSEQKPVQSPKTQEQITA